MKKSRSYSKKYKEWIKLVFIRDKYTCRHCKKKVKQIVAHHIIEWDKNKSLRYDIENGLTLCRTCHAKHHLCDKPTWNKGKKMSQETRNKMSESQKKVIHSKERNLKISNSLKGIKFTLEHKRNLSKAFKGRIVSQEAKDNMRIAAIKRLKANKLRLKGKSWKIDSKTGKRIWISGE